MSEHTPGPWKVGNQMYNPNAWEIVAPESPAWDTYVAATVHEGPHDRANARLIAASPDLYDYVKRTTALMQRAEDVESAAEKQAVLNEWEKLGALGAELITKIDTVDQETSS